MIEGLLQILVLVLILVVLFYVARLIVAQFGGPPILLQIMGVIFALIVVLALLQLVGVPMVPILRK
jgi:hypothetical protein